LHGIFSIIRLPIIVFDDPINNFNTFHRNSSLKRYVVCPIVDMFNHKSGQPSEASYNYFTGHFELRVSSCSRGEQIFINYGKQGNDRLLQYYGFIESDSMDDRYDFGDNFLEYIIKHENSFSRDKDIFSTLTPSPKIRLPIITSALKSTRMRETVEKNGKKGVSDAGKVSISLAIDSSMKYFRSPVASVAGNVRCLNHFDDISVRCARALLCSESEWISITPLSDLEQIGFPLSQKTEKCIESLFKTIAEIELSLKSTTLSEDLQLLKMLKASEENLSDSFSENGKLSDIVKFRLEKKKLLQEAIEY